MNKNNDLLKKFIRENWTLVAAVVYVLSPIDLFPDLLPMLGFGDDLLVLTGTLLY